MKKLLVCLMIAMLLLPLVSVAEDALVYERQAKKFIDFPTMDGWRGHFSSVTKWTIVTPETLDENWELVAARGDTEEEIRARYAQPNFLFEAYSPDLPEDACFRAEVYEDDVSRDVWNLRHLDAAERKKLNEYLGSGSVFPDRDVYNLFNTGSSDNCHLMAYFTNYPPATHESGRMRIDFRNGRMYVFSYCVSGRLAGASRWYTSKEKAQLDKAPLTSMETKFTGTALPQMPEYKLTTALPEVAAPGTMTFTGTVAAGSKVSAALDGQSIAANVDKKGNFTVQAELTAGEQQLTITVEKTKMTTRVMEYSLTVSDAVTPLTMTEEPDWRCIIGDVVVAGQTEPGTAVTVTVDEETTALTAGEDGTFRHTFQADERRTYHLTLTAEASGKEAVTKEYVFAADYKTTEDGIKAFNELVTDVNFKTIAGNVEEYIGTKVKISIKTKEATINEQGLGILCIYNAKQEKDQTPLYVNLPGYAQCQVDKNMIITIYATVDGTRLIFKDNGDEEERIELTADYGTYLVYK